MEKLIFVANTKEMATKSSLTVLTPMFIGIVVTLAGTFFRFIDLHSNLIATISNVVFIIGVVFCLSSVFKYIRPDDEPVND